MRDEAKLIWGRLTNEDLDCVDGNAERLVERIQARYGYDGQTAEDEVVQFLSRYSSAMLMHDGGLRSFEGGMSDTASRLF
jgi:uncharacterized protein YjbJ (UPF0337 family)